MTNGNGIKLNVGMITISVLLVLQLVAFSFGYGALNEQVSTNRILVEQNRILQIETQKQLMDLNIRLSAIELLLKER